MTSTADATGLRSLATDAGERGDVPPLARLFVLDAHREKPPLPWLDRAGYGIAARVRRVTHRPAAGLRRRARRILTLAKPLFDLDDHALQERLHALADETRAAPANAPSYTDATVAGVVAAIRRVTGLTPHPEQVMGALALLDCNIAEMATGEGKTLTTALAAVTAAWNGRPCHVVTANDYLAKRDAELFTALYAYCGLSVAHVGGDTPLTSRAAAYTHDVVYTTAKELLGDFLRDRLALGGQPSRVDLALRALGAGRSAEGQVVMRGLYQVIVDEADSVLIDEAVTPLIISTPRPDGSLDDAAKDAVRLARELEPEVHYTLNLSLRHVELTQAGKDRLEALTGTFSTFWQSPDRAQELVTHALHALHLLVRDQHYVVKDDKIVLIDELTGRLADQRTLPVGLQQVLDAAEGVPVSPPTEVSARLSFQRFFRLFPRVGGTTGTAREARPELTGVYRLRTLPIPTHRPVRRIMRGTKVFRTEEEKLSAIARDALAMADSGRAVLVGMRSVRSSEALMRHVDLLDPVRAADIRLLHAVNHAQESAIVARAGQPGAITIATNMAGRGTDIALDPAVKERGGLHVIVGEPNDFRRIDRQLVGRCSRQGDPGSVQGYVCFEDDVIRRFLPRSLEGLWRRLHGLSGALSRSAAPAMLRTAQLRAERFSFRQRQTILEQDIQLDKAGF
ncbi:preprotein translocase subunit SecA [Azospirillum sp. sgz302134]